MKQLTLILISSLAISFFAGADDNKMDADNTGKNDRDKSGDTKTPFDQSEKPEDVEMSAKIRQYIIKDESLSALAKNVKIITSNASVTLRGPVQTASEKSKIEEYAKASGAKQIINKIEINQSLKGDQQ